MSTQSDEICRKLEQAIAGVKTELASRLLAKLHDRTPVRTGYTRSRWVVTESGDVTNDAGETVMRLNDGNSAKAPAGFIEQAIDETIVEMQREVVFERPVKL